MYLNHCNIYVGFSSHKLNSQSKFEYEKIFTL